MINIIKNILSFISNKLFYFIFASIILGFLNLKFFGGFEFSSSICFLAALIMITPSLIPLNFSFLRQSQKSIPRKIYSSTKNTDKKVIALSFVLNFMISPLIAFTIGKIFFSDNKELFLGLLLLSLLPGGGMITTWALNSKSKMSLTIKIIFYNMLFAAILIPFFTKNFIPISSTNPIDTTINTNINTNTESTFFGKSAQNNTNFGINFDEIFKKNENSNSIIDIVNKEKNLQKESGCVLSEISGGYVSCGQSDNAFSNILPVIFTIIIFPLILSYLLQRFFIKIWKDKKFKDNKKYFAYFSNLGLVIILFIIMSFKNNIIIFEKPQIFFNSIIPILLFYISTFSISFFIYKKYFESTINKSAGISLFWGSTLRYLTLALAFVTAISITDPSYTIIVVIIIISFMIQIPSSYLFSKYFKKRNLDSLS